MLWLRSDKNKGEFFRPKTDRRFLLLGSVFGLFLMLGGAFYFYGMFLRASATSFGTGVVTINTTLSSSGTGTSSTQRKTFYDDLAQKHWAFYQNGANVEYSYSVNNSSWTSAGTLAYGSSNFATTYKNINNASYVFMAVECNTYDVCLKRGSLSATSISWGPEINVFDGTSTANMYIKPSVALDIANNYVWVSAIKDLGYQNAERYQDFTRRSTNAGNGDITAWVVATSIGKQSNTLNDTVIMPQTGSDMALVSGGDSKNIVSYTYNGTTWTEANAGGDNSWFSFGVGGLNGEVKALVVMGTDIYIGGKFTSAGGVYGADYITKWNGSSFSAVGGGLDFWVFSLAVMGTDLFIGGNFMTAGGSLEANSIVKWNGSSYVTLGSGLNSDVYALFVSGTDLYIGGYFTDAGGIPEADKVAKWDGNNFSALGDGLNDSVWSFAKMGSDLYIGGFFTDAGGIPEADKIVKWNGTSYSALGTGLSAEVYSMVVSGTDLYVGGKFQNAGGVATADCFTKWNGTSFSAVGAGGNFGGQYVYSLAFIGTDLYIGGWFTNGAGIAAADNIVKWNGAIYSALGTGLDSDNHSTVSTLVVSGTDLYIGGEYFDAGGSGGARNISKWNGTSFSVLENGGLNGAVQAFAVIGTDLYIGGRFTDAGGIAGADKIVKWNGSLFSALGAGLGNTKYEQVRALAVIGTDLYIGGQFYDAGGIAAADKITKWNGAAYSALGAALNGNVYSLAISGTNLYIGGEFTDAGGIAAADKITKWNGAAYSALGSGLNGDVYSMAFVGTDLYIGGRFTDAGGIADADYVTKWNGAAYNALGTGLGAGASSGEYPTAMAVIGTDLYIGGGFSDAGGIAEADFIVKWNGSIFSALGSGLENLVNSLLTVGSDLYIGGYFSSAGGVANTSGITKWNGSGYSSLAYGPILGINALIYNPTNFTLWMGGNEMQLSSGKTTYLAAYHPTAAGAFANFASETGSGNTDASTEFSAVTDVSGNIHLAYTDATDQLFYKFYNNSTKSWGGSVLLSPVTTTSPSLSIDRVTQELRAFYVQGGKVYMQKGRSPYGLANWDGYNSDIYTSTSTNSRLMSDFSSGGGVVKAVWLEGSASPYNIRCAVVSVSADPVSLNGVTSALSSAQSQSSSQRKTFFDDVNGKHWAFEYNRTGVDYSYSADGSGYVVAGSMAYPTANFAVTYKNIGGVGYVFFVSEGNAGLNSQYDVVLQKGTLSATSIAWGAVVTVFDGSSASDAYWRPSVALDVAGSYVWVSAVKDIGSGYADRYQNVTRRSTNAGNGDVSVWGSSVAVGRLTSTINDTVIMPQTGSNMALVSGGDSKNIVSYTYNGSIWSEANAGGDNSWFSFGSGLNNTVNALAVSGSDLYIGGSFSDAGGIATADCIAKWNGAAFSALGSGLNDTVYALAVSGSDLYIGGWFTDAGGIANADKITKWNGSSFSALGSGLNVAVYTLAFSGSDLYIGGDFSDAGGIANADYITKWNGTSFSALGSGLNATVFALAFSGSDLYIGGNFINAGGNASADRITKWNGTAFSALGSGLSSTVNALAVNGSDLYIGGNFTDAGGIGTADHITKWNGTAFLALGSGLNGSVYSITTNGSNIYIFGDYTDAGGDQNADYISMWNGVNYIALGKGSGGINNYPSSVVSYDPLSSRLYVGAYAGFSVDGGESFMYLSYYSMATVGNSKTSFSIAPSDANTEFSAVTDASGNIHLVYTDATDNLMYKKYDAVGASWGAAVLVKSNVNGTQLVTSPSVSVNQTTGRVYVAYKQAGFVKYKKAYAPYSASDFDRVEAFLTTPLAGQNFTIEPYMPSDSKLTAVFTNGSIDPSPNAFKLLDNIETYTWDGGGGDGLWDNPLNWDKDSGSPQGGDEKAMFNSNNSVVKLPDQPLELGNLTVSYVIRQPDVLVKLSFKNNISLSSSRGFDGSLILGDGIITTNDKQLNIDGNLTVNSPANLSLDKSQIYVKGNVIGNAPTADFRIGLSKLFLIGVSPTISTSNAVFNDIDVSISGSGSIVNSNGASYQINNLTVNSGTFNLANLGSDQTKTINNINLTGGTLNLNTAVLNLNGSFYRSGGTFNPGTNRVNLTSMSTSNLTGDLSFYDLNVDNSSNSLSKNVTFESGKTVTVTHTLTLVGSKSGGLYLSRYGGTTGNVWNLNIPANMSAGSYVNVANSAVAVGKTITADASCQDLGNNTGWIFSADAVNNNSDIRLKSGQDIRLRGGIRLK